jgi:molybdopterin/thiamine biosynthesis adenylyltransferase
MDGLVVKKLDHWRQEGIFNPRGRRPHQVNVVGVGGIGSPTVMCLSKMGMDRISAWDNDHVEMHNLPNQFYRFSDLSKSKVDGIADIVNDFSGVEVKTNNQLLKEEDAKELNGITVCGVDSLDIRRELWNGIKFNVQIPLYIDARMGGQVCRIFSIVPTDLKDIEYYEKSILPTTKPQTTPCTERAIIYNTFMIAALISNQVKKFIMGEELKREIVFDMETLSMINF